MKVAPLFALALRLTGAGGGHAVGGAGQAAPVGMQVRRAHPRLDEPLGDDAVASPPAPGSGRGPLRARLCGIGLRRSGADGGALELVAAGAGPGQRGDLGLSGTLADSSAAWTSGKPPPMTNPAVPASMAAVSAHGAPNQPSPASKNHRSVRPKREDKPH